MKQNTILIVDDSKLVLGFHERILSMAGFQTRATSHAEQALEWLIEGGIHAVMTDINMPGLDGKEFIKKIRQHPELADTPILIVSTESSEKTRIEGLSAGANLYLKKPVEPEEIVRSIKMLLGIEE